MKPESDVLIACTITERIGWHKVLLPLNQNYDKIWERNKKSVVYFHKKKKQQQQLTWWNVRQHSAHMMCSVNLHRYDMFTVILTVTLHYPITSMTNTLTY